MADCKLLFGAVTNQLQIVNVSYSNLKDSALNLSEINNNLNAMGTNANALLIKEISQNLKLSDVNSGANDILNAEKIDISGINNAANSISKAEVQKPNINLELTNANQLLIAAPSIQSDASKLLGRCNQAGRELIENVNKIRGQVSFQILKTEPDLSVLAGQLGLSMPKLVDTSGKTLTSQSPVTATSGTQPVPQTSNPTLKAQQTLENNDILASIEPVQINYSPVQITNAIKTVTDDISDFTSKVKILQSKLTNLQAIAEDLDSALNESIANYSALVIQDVNLEKAIKPINDIVNSVNAAVGSLSMPDCIVNTQPPLMSIFPPSPFNTYTNQNFLFSIQGGKPQYVIKWPLTNDMPGFNISINFVNVDNTPTNSITEVNVFVNALATVGSHTFLILDSLGGEKAVVINVQDKPKN